MKLLSAILLTAIAFSATADPMTPREIDRVVSAISITEGGQRYGVKSVRTRSTAHAREICRRTVVNNRKAWEYDGRPGEWIEYLGAQYCPAETDPVGHRNWMRNMRKILKIK